MYQDVWSAGAGEQLTCDQEPGNRHDTFAVAVKKMKLLWAMCPDVFHQFVMFFTPRRNYKLQSYWA